MSLHACACMRLCAFAYVRSSPCERSSAHLHVRVCRCVLPCMCVRVCLCVCVRVLLCVVRIQNHPRLNIQ